MLIKLVVLHRLNIKKRIEFRRQLRHSWTSFLALKIESVVPEGTEQVTNSIISVAVFIAIVRKNASLLWFLLLVNLLKRWGSGFMVLSKVWAVWIAIANKSETAFELFGICAAHYRRRQATPSMLMSASRFLCMI